MHIDMSKETNWGAEGGHNFIGNMWDGMLLKGSVLGMQNEIIRLRKIVEELRHELNSKQHDYDKLQNDVRLAKEASHIQETQTLRDQIAHREDAIRHMQSGGDSKRSSMLGMFVGNKGIRPTKKTPLIHYPPPPQQVHINHINNGVSMVNPDIKPTLHVNLGGLQGAVKAGSKLLQRDPSKPGFKWDWGNRSA